MRVFLIALAVLYWVCVNAAQHASIGPDAARAPAAAQRDAAVAGLNAAEPPYAEPPARPGACAAQAGAAGSDAALRACLEAEGGAPR